MNIGDILNDDSPKQEKRHKTNAYTPFQLPPVTSFVAPNITNYQCEVIINLDTNILVSPKERNLLTAPQNQNGAFALSHSNSNIMKQKQVDMFYDMNCTSPIIQCSQINKDIIICFILFNAVNQGIKGSRLPIDESVLYLGKRKNYQNSSVNGTTLHAELLAAESRKPVQICGTCLKSSSQIFKIRSAIIDDNNTVKVAASITCSGSPPASNKKLTVQFSIRNSLGNIEWQADSPLFTLLHHRSKRNIEKNDHAMQIYAQLGEIMPSPPSRLPLLQFNVPRNFPETNMEMMKMVEFCLTNMWNAHSSNYQKLKYALADDVQFLFSTHHFVGIDKLLTLGKTLANSLDDFESRIDDVCFTGNLIEGKVATKGYNRGKWVRPVGNYEPTGEVVSFPAFTFWTIRERKIVTIESLIDNGQVPKWQLAWNNVQA